MENWPFHSFPRYPSGQESPLATEDGGWGSVLATAGGARSTDAGTATTAAADSPTLRAALALLLCAAAQTQQQQ
ncbi:Protein of unknown function, partial [Gryllus bimaculatus]